MNFSELIFPSCPLCRKLRIAMGIGFIIVVAEYSWILLNMKEDT